MSGWEKLTLTPEKCHLLVTNGIYRTKKGRNIASTEFNTLGRDGLKLEMRPAWGLNISSRRLPGTGAHDAVRLHGVYPPEDDYESQQTDKSCDGWSYWRNGCL